GRHGHHRRVDGPRLVRGARRRRLGRPGRPLERRTGRAVDHAPRTAPGRSAGRAGRSRDRGRAGPPSAAGWPQQLVTAAPDHPLLLACRNQPAPRTPVWFMRQAGRALPEYHEVRGTGTILEAVRHPELAAEITLQPVRRYGVDAAILYSDIVVPVASIGFGVDVVPGVGPVVDSPFSGPADLGRIRPLDPEKDIPYVLDAVRLVVQEL